MGKTNKEKSDLDFKAHIGFKLDYKKKEELKKQAKKEERTVSNLLVKIVKKYLKENK